MIVLIPPDFPILAEMAGNIPAAALDELASAIAASFLAIRMEYDCSSAIVIAFEIVSVSAANKKQGTTLDMQNNRNRFMNIMAWLR